MRGRTSAPTQHLLGLTVTLRVIACERGGAISQRGPDNSKVGPLDSQVSFEGHILLPREVHTCMSTRTHTHMHGDPMSRGPVWKERGVGDREEPTKRGDEPQRCCPVNITEVCPLSMHSLCKLEGLVTGISLREWHRQAGRTAHRSSSVA